MLQCECQNVQPLGSSLLGSVELQSACPPHRPDDWPCSLQSPSDTTVSPHCPHPFMDPAALFWGSHCILNNIAISLHCTHLFTSLSEETEVSLKVVTAVFIFVSSTPGIMCGPQGGLHTCCGSNERRNDLLDEQIGSW